MWLKEVTSKASTEGGIGACMASHNHVVRHYNGLLCSCSCHDSTTHAEGVDNPFEGMDPKEINFITHPHWVSLIEQIERDPNMAYTITQEGKPIAVIISPVVYERMEAQLAAFAELDQVVKERP